VRISAGLALLTALSLLGQDQPTYNKNWKEESILAKGKHPKTGRDAAVVQVRFVRPHKLSECLGADFARSLRDYPAARLFTGADGWIRANFKTGDRYHLHVLRENGEDQAMISEDVSGVTLSSADLKGATRLVAVSSRYDMTLSGGGAKAERFSFPPYAVSIRLDADKDPMAEGGAQTTAQLGNSDKGGSVLADVRAFSDQEFALGVWHEGEGAPIEVGFGEHQLNPRLTFEGSVGSTQQHVGIYPIPPVARRDRGDLTVGVGPAAFNYRDFHHTMLDVEYPQEVEALEAKVKGAVTTIYPSVPLTALLYSGSIGAEATSIRTESHELGERREWEPVVRGEAETFFFMRLWSGWKGRGGMLGCGLMEPCVAAGPYKYIVDPPARPFAMIRLKGSGKAKEAAEAVAPDPGVALGPMLASGLLGLGMGSLLFSEGGRGGGSGPASSSNPPAGAGPGVSNLPAAHPDTIAVGDSQRIGGIGGRPAPGPGPGPGPGPAPREVFRLSADMGALDFGTVYLGDTPTKTFKLTYTFDDGDPNAASVKRLHLPAALGGVFHISTPLQALPEGKDLQVEVSVRFAPARPGRHLQQLTIQHDASGRPQVDHRMSLRGEAITRPRLEVGIEQEVKFDNTPVGASKTYFRKGGIKIAWDDGDPKNIVPVQVQFELKPEDGTPEGVFTLAVKNPQLINEPGDATDFRVVFAPPSPKEFSAKIFLRFLDPRTREVVSERIIRLLGRGIDKKDIPVGPIRAGEDGPVIQVPKGSVFHPSKDYEVVIKDRNGMTYLFEGDEFTCTNDPIVQLTPKHGSGEKKYFTTIPPVPGQEQSRRIPTPEGDKPPANEQPPRVELPEGSHYTFPHRVDTPPSGNPGTYTVDQGPHRQALEFFGTLFINGVPYLMFGARVPREGVGQPWTFRNPDGKPIHTIETYSWQPVGPPEIYRDQTGQMQFKRIGKGPACKIEIIPTNLSILEVSGEIAQVSIEGGGIKASGKVPEGSPTIGVKFRANNLEKLGRMKIVEVPPDQEKDKKK
jgi:hypothetical protein